MRRLPVARTAKSKRIPAPESDWTAADWRGKSVLVTGASGFIGAHLANRLCELGAVVHGISRKLVWEGSNGITWWQGDLCDPKSLTTIFEETKPEIIFHLAGLPNGSRDSSVVLPTLQANFLSTVHLLAAAKESGCKRVILSGSLEEPEPGDAHPSSPYAASKWAAAGYARMFQVLYGLEIVNLRLFMVYGPAQNDTKKLIPYVISTLLDDVAPSLSSGNRPVDWIYVSDVVDAYLKAAQAENLDGQSIDIGSGKLATVREIAHQLASLVNPGISLKFGDVPDRPLEQVRVANIKRAKALLSWQPKVTLQEGLRRTVEWYRSQVRSVNTTIGIVCALLMLPFAPELVLEESKSSVASHQTHGLSD